jgi:GTPase SAR1 family protein
MRSEPTVFENYVHDLYVDEQLVELSLWDTAGVYHLVITGWQVGLTRGGV